MRSKLIRVHSAINPFEAQIVKSALEQAGIRTTLRNELLAPLAGALPAPEVMAEVWIEEEDAAAAAEILAPILERQTGELSLPESGGGELSLEPDDTPDRACANCKETSPAHFAECWQCQTPFEEA